MDKARISHRRKVVAAVAEMAAGDREGACMVRSIAPRVDSRVRTHAIQREKFYHRRSALLSNPLARCHEVARPAPGITGDARGQCEWSLPAFALALAERRNTSSKSVARRLGRSRVSPAVLRGPMLCYFLRRDRCRIGAQTRPAVAADDRGEQSARVRIGDRCTAGRAPQLAADHHDQHQRSQHDEADRDEIHNAIVGMSGEVLR